MATMAEKLANMTSTEAANMPPRGRNDKAVTIFCGNKVEQWKSRQNATDFYRICSESCDGSEAERYSQIYFSLIEGCVYPNDEYLTDAEMIVKLATSRG